MSSLWVSNIFFYQIDQKEDDIGKHMQKNRLSHLELVWFNYDSIFITQYS